MKAVSHFEADLLRVLHALLGRVPVEQVLPLVLHARPQPRCLSRDAVWLAQDALAKGCTQWLARVGGWRRARHLRGEQAVEGRLWERTPPSELALAFSRHALAFLVWLTTSRPVAGAGSWRAPADELTRADCLLVFLAHEVLRGTEARNGLQSLPAVRSNVLCRLAYPSAFLHGPALDAAAFLPWTTGLGSCMLEVLQPHLARCWIDLEAVKCKVSDWEAMQALGRAQESVLVPFLDALEQAGRFDLARFVLEAGAALLTPAATPRFWVGGLAGAGPRLADRTTTNRAALAFVRQMDRLRRWERSARGVGYFDEGYAAAQLCKSDWERYSGDALHARAAEIIQALDPLSVTGGAES
jgi:hypothetical protein